MFRFFSTPHVNRSKRQAEDFNEPLHNFFDHPPEICALGRYTNGSAFAFFFEKLSEFKACTRVGCIPNPTFQIEHTSKEECEDAVNGIPTCISFTNVYGFSKTSHCVLPIHWDDRFPTRQTYAELEYCGIDFIPIVELFGDVRFFQFQKASDCEYLVSNMPIAYIAPPGYLSPFDIEIGVCRFIFYANYTFETEWCGFPIAVFALGLIPQCNERPSSEDIRLQNQVHYISTQECASLKVLEAAYQYTLEEDPDGLRRCCFIIPSDL